MSEKGLIFECCDYRNKFKVSQAIWNPRLDVLALASANGEVCLKRFYWKTGWQKKLASEVYFFSKGNTVLDEQDKGHEVGSFASMCWSPDGSVLVVAFSSGVCHLLDVNDALILYTLRLDCAPIQMKWFKLEGLDVELTESKRKQLFNNENSFNSSDCENLRTKDSDSQRDNYKIVYGLQSFCHQRVNSILMDSILVVVGAKDDFIGFDVYISGMFLLKSVIIDCGFLPNVCDPSKLKVQDFCLLDNQNLQFALSAPLNSDSLARPEFDLTAGFSQPIDESAKGESCYLVEYDLDFNNRTLMASAALLSARTCHVFHLLTCLRENFQRACVDWDTMSEQFHINVFGTLYAKYEEESEGLLADFALDFIAYILTGNYNETFSQAFFRDIKVKDWKPAREFVVKHIPAFLHSITKYIQPSVEILYIHLRSLKGEMQRFERNLQCRWTSARRLGTNVFDRSLFPEDLESEPIEQLESAIEAVCHLSRQLKQLAMVGNKNWADLKYVLQLLSSHPDNEQLKIDIEDDYDGIKRMDFEILLNFITDALVDPEKKKDFGNWTNFLHHWKAKLVQSKAKKTSRPLICNPNWLKHRLFDKIGLLLGTCSELPKPKPLTRLSQRLNGLDCSEATTVTDAIGLCFQSLNDLYMFGIRDLNGNTEQPNILFSHCLEFCHPHPITRLRLMPSSKFTKPQKNNHENANTFNEFLTQYEIEDAKSVVFIHRSSSSTLHSYLAVGSHQKGQQIANVCSPDNILKLGVFGSADQFPSSLDTKLEVGEMESKFQHSQFRVLTWDLYNSGSLHLVVSFNSESLSNSATYIIRCDLMGRVEKVDETPISFVSHLSLYTSPSSPSAVLFEHPTYDSLKWFELEDRPQRRRPSTQIDKDQRILMAHSIQQIDKATSRSALNRKRKLTARLEDNRRPASQGAEAMETDAPTNDENAFDPDVLDENDDAEVDQDEPTAEQLRNGYLVVEIEEPSTPSRLPSPTFSAGSPVLLQINEFARFTPPSQTAPSTPPTAILNMVRFGSPATASTASSPNRVIADSPEGEEERTEDQEDFAIDEDANTNRVNDDDEDNRTEHDIEIVDLENSRDDEVLTEHNRDDEPLGHGHPRENDEEAMEQEPPADIVRIDDEEETREAL